MLWRKKQKLLTPKISWRSYAVALIAFVAFSAYGDEKTDFVYRMNRAVEKGHYQQALTELDLFERDHGRFSGDLHAPWALDVVYLRARIYELLNDVCAARFFALQALERLYHDPSTSPKSAPTENELAIRSTINRLAEISESCSDGSSPHLSRMGTGISDGCAYDISTQNDGKILLAGNFKRFNDLPAKGIVRINPDGSLDQTFTRNATKVLERIAETWEETNNADVQPDGKILVAMTQTDLMHMRVFRLLPNGKLDAAFKSSDISRSEKKGGFDRLIVSARFPNGDIVLGTFVGQFEKDGKLYGPVISITQNGEWVSDFPIGSDKDFSVHTLADQGIGTDSNGNVIIAGWMTDNRSNISGPLLRINTLHKVDHSYFEKAAKIIPEVAHVSTVVKDSVLISVYVNSSSMDIRGGFHKIHEDGSKDKEFSFNGPEFTGWEYRIRDYRGIKRLWMNPQGILQTSGYSIPTKGLYNFKAFDSQGKFDQDNFSQFKDSQILFSDFEPLPNGRFIVTSFLDHSTLRSHILFRGLTIIDPSVSTEIDTPLSHLVEKRGPQGVVSRDGTELFKAPSAQGEIFAPLKKTERVQILERGDLLDKRQGQVDYWQKVRNERGTIGWVFGGDLSYLPSSNELDKTTLIGACLNFEDGQGFRVTLIATDNGQGLKAVPTETMRLEGLKWVAGLKPWQEMSSDGRFRQFEIGPITIQDANSVLYNGSPPITESRIARVDLGPCVEENRLYSTSITTGFHAKASKSETPLSSQKEVTLFSKRNGQRIKISYLTRSWPYEK